MPPATGDDKRTRLMIKAKRLGHVTFETPDLARAIAYYTEVVGLVLISRGEREAFLSTRIGQLAVELRLGAQARCEQLSFEIEPTIEHADVVRRLAEHGIKADECSDAAPGISRCVTFS